MTETRALSILGYNREIDRLEAELETQRKQLEKWRRFGRNVIDQVHDWSTGHISRSVFISKETEAAIQEMLDD